MKSIFRLLGIFALIAFVGENVYSQPYPVIGSGGSQVTPGGVWSKNMELICPLSLPTNSQEMFQFSQIKYGSSLGSTGFYIITTDEADGSDPSEIRLIDVTLPRTLNSTALKIRVSGASCRDIEVWTDNSTGNAFSGHTFAVVYVGNNLMVFHDEEEESPDIYGSYLIFDLSEALTCGATTLTVDDPKVREVSGTGLDATYEKSVYLGYIRRDNYFLFDDQSIPFDGPHTTNIEKNLGIFMTNGGRGYSIHPNVTGPKTYIDLYDLAIIAPNTTDANRTSSTLIEIPRLGTAVTGPAAIEPVVLTMPTTPTDFTHLIPGPHEVSGEKVGTKKIRLFVSAYGQTNANAGGVVMINVDYTDPDNVTYDGHQYWQYDVDRVYPSHKTSGREVIAPSTEPDWQFRPAHSTELITIGSGSNTKKYVLATTESNSWYDRSFTLNTSNGTYTGSNWAELYDGTNENDKLIGNYLRIWETDLTAGYPVIIGTGTNEGPISSYDPIEQAPSSGAHYTSSALRNSQISTISSTAGDDLTSSTAVGISTVHRARSVPGSTDVFIASYSQGARVIDLKDMSASNPEVKEKAFFDFIPTLNYAKNSEYFYLNANHGGNGAFTTFFPDGFKAYFMGTEDIRADVERSGVTTESWGLPSDEKFVYAFSHGEGFMSGETLPRNWLNNSGFLILRYFDDKIGGTIAGYVGTSDWNNRSHREVNLQGTFSVERNTIIASGATVNLLDGTKLNKKTSYNNEYIEVFGTLNIQTAIGSSTRGIVDVPIKVRAGGKLIINSAKEVDFLGSVTVDLYGELRIESGAKVIFGSQANTCNGKFIVNGTTTAHVKIYPKQNTSRTAHDGHAYFQMKGNGLSTTKLQIHYAEVENVYINAEKVYPGTPMLLNSSFSGHTNTLDRRFLVNYNNSLSSPWSPSPMVYGCTFKDRNQTPTNGSFRIQGLRIVNSRAAWIISSTFEYLATGATVMGGLTSNIYDNTIHDCSQGIIVSDNIPSVCSNDLDNLGIGYWGINTLSSFLSDNTIDDAQIAAAGFNLGTMHFLRGNQFDQYCTGLSAFGTSLQLRDWTDPSDGIIYKFGRNSFNVSGNTISGWGCFTIDLHLFNSTLDIDCGYNLFSENSLVHAFGNIPGQSFTASFNEWRDVGSTFNVRTNTNLTAIGTPLNTSQTTTASCSRLIAGSGCPSITCDEDVLSIIEFNDDTLVFNEDSVRWKFDSVWGWQASPTAALACRLQYLEAAYMMAVMLDSSIYYETARDEFDDAYADTYDSSAIRSRALMLKGLTLERMDSISAAVTAYTTLVSNFASSVDSLPAAWRIQYLGAVLDTVIGDSLLDAYHWRVFNDIKRITSHPSGVPKMADGKKNLSHIRNGEVILEQNVPNPWNAETTIAFKLPNAGIVRLSILDVLGNEIAVLVDGEQKAGRSQIKYSKDLAEGIYFYRLQYGNEVITQKMTKSK